MRTHMALVLRLWEPCQVGEEVREIFLLREWRGESHGGANVQVKGLEESVRLWRYVTAERAAEPWLHLRGRTRTLQILGHSAPFSLGHCCRETGVVESDVERPPVPLLKVYPLMEPCVSHLCSEDMMGSSHRAGWPAVPRGHLGAATAQECQLLWVDPRKSMEVCSLRNGWAVSGLGWRGRWYLRCRFRPSVPPACTWLGLSLGELQAVLGHPQENLGGA